VHNLIRSACRQGDLEQAPRNFKEPMRRLVLLVALIVPLCACGTGRPRAPDLRLPARYEALQGEPMAPADLDHWWLAFGAPQLDALEDEAFRLSPDAKTASARLLEAKATRDSLTAQTLPTGNLSGNANERSSTSIGGTSNSLFPVGGRTESETLNFDVSWELDLFGRLAQARKVANADLAATRFDVEASRASLAASVADSYFQARGFAIQLDDARQSARIEGELQAVAQKKAALGLGASEDADRVAGDLAQARSQVENYQAELRVAQRLLLILVGRAAEPTGNLPIDATVGQPPPAPAAVPGDLLTRRPDVREAEAKLRSAAGHSRMQHLALFPTVTLLPGLGLSRTVAPGVSFIPPATLVPAQQTTSLGFWTLGVGVSQPVLDIPRLLADARAQDARTEQAVIAYEKAVQTAFGEAESALVRLAADERRLAVLDEGEVRAGRAFEAAQKGYALGLTDLPTALSAEQSWRTTRSALTAERVQALRRAVQAYKALGGGWAFEAAPAPATP